jgi:hypothetical protein
MPRIHWDDDQIESLAQAFVRLRLKDPLITVRPLLKRVQEECLVPEQRRALACIKVEPRLYDRVRTLWRHTLEQSAPPPPQIIEILVEKPIDYTVLAARLDTPSLMALLTQRVTDGLASLRLAIGAEQPAVPVKTIPMASLLVPPVPEKKYEPRVAFCHVELKVFSQLKEQVERFKIPVELRGVDIAKRGAAVPLSADFVVFMNNCVGGVSWKSVMSSWPHGRIFVVDNNLPSALQKMRDIVSLNLHVPAPTATRIQTRA